MATATTERFDDQTKQRMQTFYATLNEKDQRRFATLEALRIGHGGITCIAELLGCCTKTIQRGIDEFETLANEDDPVAGRIRRPGAGQKKR